MTYNIEEIRNFFKNFETDENGHFTDATSDEFIGSIDADIVPNYTWEIGTTKLVIIPFERDYVIKIPFDGSYDHCYEDCDECPYERHCTREENFLPFSGGMGEWSEDYCAKEIAVFQDSVKFGYDQFFLPLIKVDVNINWPVYIQSKVETYADLTDDIKNLCTEKSLESIQSRKEKVNLPDVWLANCLDILKTEKELKGFLWYLDITNTLQDLHFGNFGYKDGKAVIIDYAGYWE